MKDIGLLIVNTTCELRDVIKKIDSNSKGMVFVENEKKQICGVMTDGDVRRLFLQGYGLNSPIIDLYNKKFVYFFYGSNYNEQLEKVDIEFKTRLIPILDADYKIVDYIDNRGNSAVSLAKPQLNGNEYNYLMDAFLSTWISSTGKYIKMFEHSFAEYCGVEYGVATSNGTTALHLALLALNIGEGDEVIVPDLTFAATVNSVIYTRAIPKIVDIEEDGWCISPQAIKDAITAKTKAIIVVHLYGQPCKMDEICEIAKDNNLFVIEDCAEAHGACFDAKKVGSFGDIACFSFYGNKVITTGEGGMCLTAKRELADRMEVLRDHGMSKEHRYYHEVVGYNYRMTNMQAAIGAAQVERIEEILAWRKELEDKYVEKLTGIEDIVFQNRDLVLRDKITWLVSILLPEEKRECAMNNLKAEGIDVRAFFVPMSEMKIYEKYAVNCVISKKIARQGINLPTTFEIKDDEIERIATILRNM